MNNKRLSTVLHTRLCLVLGLFVILALLAPDFVPAGAQAEATPAAADDPAALETALQTGEMADWWTATQENIRQMEYNVTWQEQTYLQDVPAAYQAPNRASNLRTYFTPDGLQIIPRVWGEGVETPPWRWGLSLAGQEAAELVVQDNCVAYTRTGVVEQLCNTESGLEQAFTLQQAQFGVQGEVRLLLRFSGDVTGRAALDGSAVEFVDAQGNLALRYGPFLAEDAAGQSLAVRLELGESELWVVADAVEAVFPLRVETIILGLADSWNWKVEGNKTETEFGRAVSTAGDVNGDGYSDVIIGAPRYDGGQTDEGKAFIFHGSSSGLSTTASWSVEINQIGARYGAAVSTAGDINGDRYADVIVGAPYYEDGNTDEGGFWVYLGSVGGVGSWHFHSEGNQGGAYMGMAVGTAGDVNNDGYADIIVGAPYMTWGQIAEGVVRVWHGSASGISTTAYIWQAQSNQADAHFGNSVSTAGDVNGDGYADVIVGAPEYDNGSVDEGMVFVWRGSASGLNTGVDGSPTNDDWSVDSGQASALMGVDVSLAGDVNGDGYADVIVGAPYYSNGQANEGRSYVYHGSATGLSTTPSTVDEGNQVGVHFGTAVGTAGDVNGDGYADVAVGAPYYTDGEDDEGRVWVWHGSASGLSVSNDWNTQPNNTDAHFGLALATAGDVNGDGYSDLLVGAPGYHNTLANEGAAFVYHGAPATLSATENWIKDSDQANAYFGWSVGTAGDVNGDGYADIIVGAYAWDDGQIDEGGAWVYHGSDAGVISAPAWYKPSDHANTWFGFSVGTAGDVNGDGYSDVIVGAPYWIAGELNEGGAWIYYGSSSGVNLSPAWYKQSDHTDALFGYSVGTAGDVNGDGYSDVIVGAPYYDHPTADEGMAWVYHGSASGVHSAPDWDGESDFLGARYGYSVSTAGDVNGDGYSDVIVGSPDWMDDVIDEGRAWVYHGSAAGLQDAHAWHAESNQYAANLGFSVSTAGDVNGDGFSDVIIGAPYWDEDGENEGKVWVFQGSAAGLSATSSWSKRSAQTGAQYGYSVSTAGDVNGDGYADIILGAPLMNGAVTDEGAVRVYCGSASGLVSSPSWAGQSGQGGAWYGHSVSSAGDVNGDGYAEVLVGAKNYNNGEINEGMVFLLYGNASRGVSLRPRQMRATTNFLVAPLGRSDHPSYFRINIAMWTPFGRVALAPYFEVKALGKLFNGHDLRWWGSYINMAAGTNSPTTLNLSPCTMNHWRVRLVYKPSSNPFMPASRWFTNPWNGWNEADLAPAGGCTYLPVVLDN